MEYSINIDKVKTLILYLSDKVEDLYVTKLMKLLYYLDFISYAERNSSVTNDIYYKLPYGPIPSFIKNEIDNLETSSMENGVKSQFSNIIELKESKDKYGKLIIAKDKKYDLKQLSKYELDLANEVIAKIGKKTATFLTKKTHKEKPFLATSYNSIIDYELSKTLGGRAVLN